MTSLADAPELIGFFSYSRDDDEDSENALSKLRLRIQNELRAQLGRSRHTLRLWQDAEAIAPGTLWEAQIDAAVAQSSFFIPIITPRVVASHYCSFELQKFIDREKALGRSDLVFPILYIGVTELANERTWRNHAVLRIVGERQYVDWREFRYEPDSVAARRAIANFCSNIATSLKLAVASTESAREKVAHKSHIKTDERASASPQAAERNFDNSDSSLEEVTKLDVSTRPNVLTAFLQNLSIEKQKLSYRNELLMIIGFIALSNLLYISSINWLNNTIPYLRSISSYIPGAYFGLVLCYIECVQISKWIAWAITMFFTILGWYLAVYATIAFMGEPIKIDPGNYLFSSLGGAVGGVVGIGCCLVGVCIGDRRLVNVRCISTVVLVAVLAGFLLLPPYLRTSKADLQAWNFWAFWLLLAGWQSVVAVALRHEIGLRMPAARG